MFGYGFLVGSLFGGGGEKNDVKVTSKTTVDTPNAKEFKAVADAIDNLKVGSKMGIEDQLSNYLDKDGSKGVKMAMKNAELANKNSLTAKGVNEIERYNFLLNKIL